MAHAVPAPAAATADLALTGAASRIVPALCAMLLGLFVVGIAGFSQIDVVHNAAHDTRHSNGFPCH
jgi:cobalt transporter subunit CbtB